MYVAVKGGEKAIDAAHALLAKQRRGAESVTELSVDQIEQQMALAVSRVMTEGSCYDTQLAALAIKQSQGDLVEAIFLLRAYRTTLPRLATSEPLDTSTMEIKRRISATFKDLPGGQILGPTYDYTHRLLDFSLMAEAQANGSNTEEGIAQLSVTEAEKEKDNEAVEAPIPRVMEILNQEGLIEPASQNLNNQDNTETPGDLTRHAISLPAARDIRLQNLARGDEGFLLALGYATQRGYGHTHPFAGEIRLGAVEVEITPPELGFSVCIGTIEITECEMVNQFKGNKTTPPQFTRGYGLTFGHSERKAMAMALVDRALRAEELGEPVKSAAQDQEFVMMHSDNVEASGFVQHLKLPHYVDFQSELELIRKLRAKQAQQEDGNDE